PHAHSQRVARRVPDARRLPHLLGAPGDRREPVRLAARGAGRPVRARPRRPPSVLSPAGRHHPRGRSVRGQEPPGGLRLMFLVQNAALLIWGADLRGYQYLARTVSIAGFDLAANRLAAVAGALVLSLWLILLLGGA